MNILPFVLHFLEMYAHNGLLDKPKALDTLLIVDYFFSLQL